MQVSITHGSNLTVSADLKLSIPDQILARVYYVLCTATDLIQAVAKVAVAIFSTSIAVLCFGQSSVLNRVTTYFWKDTWFSTKMFFQSIRGMFDPAGAYKAKATMHVNNTLDFHANNINLIVNCASRLLFAANMVKEVAVAALAFVRFTAATAMSALSLGYAEGTCVLGVGSLFSMNRATAMAGVSFAGVFAPASVLHEMHTAELS